MASTVSLKHSVLAAAVAALGGMGDAFLYVFLPAQYTTLGFSAISVGVLLSVNRFSRLFINTIVARQVVRYGVRNAMKAGAALAALITILYGFTASIIVWIILRICWGFAFSALRLGSTYYAAGHLKMGLSLGISRSVTESGAALALLLAPLLPGIFNVSLTFTLLGIFAFAGLIIALHLPDVQITMEDRTGMGLKAPGSLNAVVLGSAFLVEGMMTVLAARLVMHDHVIPPAQATVLAGIALSYRRIAMIMFSPLAGWLADRWSFRAVFDLSAVMILAGILLVAAGQVVAGMITSFTFAAMNTCIAPVSNRNKGKYDITSISGNATWRDIGAACGTLTGALLIGSSVIHICFFAGGLVFATKVLYRLKPQLFRHLFTNEELSVSTVRVPEHQKEK